MKNFLCQGLYEELYLENGKTWGCVLRLRSATEWSLSEIEMTEYDNGELRIEN